MGQFPHVSLISLMYFLIILGNLESRSFKMTHLQCKSLNESFAIFKTCELKAINRYRNELTLYANLLRIPITNVKMSLLIRKRIKNYNRSIYEYRVDGCAFLRNIRRNPVAELFFNFIGLNTHSNLNHTCPFDHDIILDRYSISNKYDVLLPLPVGSYAIQSFWETDGVRRAEISGLMEVLA